MNELRIAHNSSSFNRKLVLESSKCACFYCLETFSPSEIREWGDPDEDDVGQTAICPRCGIDSVLGDKSGQPMTQEFLKRMNEKWFG